MKKLILVIAFCSIMVGLKANPLPTPITIGLSELAFDENGWTIEIRLYNYSTIDSIWIKTTSGISRVKQFKLTPYNDILLLRKDSMMSNLNVNPLGDSIQLLYKTHGRFIYDTPYFIFGNLPKAETMSPKPGQSIAFTDSVYYHNSFSIDKSPTLGTANNTDGMFGTLTGKIYDKSGLPISGTVLYNSSTGFNMNVQNDGSYSTQVYSRNKPIGQLIYKENNRDKLIIYIAQINVVMQPDSVVTVDIYLQDTTTAGLKNVKQNAVSLMKISPNPIKNGLLNYEIALPILSSNCSIELINLQGQKTATFKISESQGVLTLPSTIADGVYSSTLMVNGKLCCTTKIVIVRK